MSADGAVPESDEKRFVPSDEKQHSHGSRAFATFAYAGPAIPIPDSPAAGISVPITVVPSGVITDLDVALRISHTWQGDLVMSLTKSTGDSAGTVVFLISRPGQTSSAGVGFSTNDYGAVGNLYIIDDSATRVYDSTTAGYGVGTAGVVGVTPVTGTWKPFGNTVNSLTGSTGVHQVTFLSAFNGIDQAGTWTLFVQDNASLDTGSVIEFELRITSASQGNE